MCVCVGGGGDSLGAGLWTEKISLYNWSFQTYPKVGVVVTVYRVSCSLCSLVWNVLREWCSLLLHLIDARLI